MSVGENMLSSLERPMTKEESYVQRRQLFKSIWDTALNIDEKEDILVKPKVIKTLRMDEIDKCPIGKSKKQRIKNLRHVCNRILDFCNRQEADDLFYERIAAAGGVSKNEDTPIPKAQSLKPKKTKVRVKRKFRKVKSMTIPKFMPNNITVGRLDIHENMSSAVSAGSSQSAFLQTKQKNEVKTVKRRAHKKKSPKNVRIKTADFPTEETAPKRRVHKKKQGSPGKKTLKKSTIKTTSPQIISV